MPKRSIEDTRRFRRRTLRLLVDYVCDRGVRCEYAPTLGAGGLFIESEESIPKATVLKMRFRLPGGEGLHEIGGRVVWTRGGANAPDTPHAPGMGIQFTDSVATAKLARELEDLD